MSDDYVEHATTYEAVRAVKREVGVIAKSRSTDSSSEDFRYQFRGVEELLEVLGPLCEKHGVITTPVLAGEVDSTQYDTRRGGHMHRVMATYEVWAYATPDLEDRMLLGRWRGEAADSGDKASTKAGSVAYREIMFKAFSIPTRGSQDDPEGDGDQEEKRAASAADRAEQQKAAQLAGAQARGWANLDDLDEGWEALKGYCAAKGESGEWCRAWVSSQQIKRGNLTPMMLAEIETTMAGAKQNGDWKAGHEPPAIEKGE